MSRSLAHCNKPITYTAIGMWALAASFYCFQFLMRVAPGTMSVELMNELGLHAGSLGFLNSWYYRGYAFSLILTGLSLDHYGVRVPMSLAALISMVGCLLFSSFKTIEVMSLGRFLMGVGSTYGFLSSCKIIQSWFPERSITLFVGFTLFMGTIGATFAGAPMAIATDLYGWTTVINGLACLALALSVFFFLFVRMPHEKENVHETLRTKVIAEPPLTAIRAILKNPQTWYVGTYGFLMYIPLSGFADMWGVPFLIKKYHLSRPTAAGILMTLYAGMGLGSALNDYTSRLFKSHLKPMRYGALLSFISLLIVVYVELSHWALYLVLFSIGFGVAMHIIAFTTVLFNNPKERGGSSTGIHNMLCMLSGVVIQPLVGVLIDYSWSGETSADGLPLYNLADYERAMIAIPLATILAFFISFLMKDSFISKTQQKEL